MQEVECEVEPVFMDEEMLHEAAMVQIPTYPHIENLEEIKHSDILRLQLEFKNIPKIQFLWEFTSLTRLDLNNNLIEKIEGLDRLVNLTWLTLSFNKIEKMEGLESLRRLEVLNLTHNRIAVIENLDTLEKLTHLYIGSNRIEQLDNVLYLRKFETLFALALSGNPVSEEDEYKFFIAAYFPKLMYLDYKLLDAKTKNEAAVKYHYVLEKMKGEELQIQQAKEKEQRQKDEVKLHKDAFVEFLTGSYMFKSMFKDDPEADIFPSVPGMADLLRTFEKQMAELCKQLFQIGLDEHKRREEEVSSFFSGHAKSVRYYQQKTSQILASFEEQHNERISELQQLSDPEVLRVEINHCNDEINQLSSSLLELEFHLYSGLEDIIQKLDANVSEMIVNFVESAEDIFAQFRDLEDNYYENVKKIAVTTLENVAKKDVEVELPDDVKLLFKSKETVMDALATGHDNHLQTIIDQETQLIMRANVWKVALIKRIEDNELEQNRKRISTVHRYMNYLREQLEELQ
ncbi:dynein regulatory complex subunit 3 [Larimichthys crocea]|uniref:dynein regulatory complex subunit 3 n=1 Tax=Larimichthys crocea TaxID=215358 RepID=UPI000F5DC80D|nr:dynein regulatory complex subunit 3 [Larimichthys crocea]